MRNAKNETVRQKTRKSHGSSLPPPLETGGRGNAEVYRQCSSPNSPASRSSLINTPVRFGKLAEAVFFSAEAAIRRVMSSRTFGIFDLPSKATARAGPSLAKGSVAYQYMT